MDKFPNAFRRFERVVDVSKITSFQQLLTAFSHWAGRKWVGSQKQIQALKVEAERLGIPEGPVTLRSILGRNSLSTSFIGVCIIVLNVEPITRIG